MTDEHDLSRYRGLSHAVLSREELDALLLRMCEARGGDTVTYLRLRNQVVASTMRFAALVAKRHRGASFEDKMQMAVEGCMRACETYDPSREVSFVTYAAIWIKATIQRAVANTEATVRLPVYINGAMSKVRRAVARHEHRHGEMPSAEVIAESAGLDIHEVRRAMAINSAPPRSLDTPVSRDDEEEGSTTLGDRITDETANPEEALLAKERVALATELAGKLSPKKHEIIARRFGLNGYQGETFDLKEIGVGLGCSRERVRQLQEEALEDMAQAMRTASARDVAHQ